MSNDPRTQPEEQRMLRRALVAQLLLQRYSVREITERLASPDAEPTLLNPQTGQPYSESTIRQDAKEIRSLWADSARLIEERRAQQFALYDALIRKGFESGDWETVRRILKDEVQLARDARADYAHEDQRADDLAAAAQRLRQRLQGLADEEQATDNQETPS